MPSVTFDHVRKQFGDTLIVEDFGLHIPDGELLVLVGGSGSGKSTILRMVAGLESVTSGSIRIDDRDITHLAPRDRDVAMVFQDYALYPHLSVSDNLSLGLRLRGVPKAEIARRVEWAAGMLEISPLLDRKPKQLSGGQRQRVAMGRAMVREPLAFLFDEPLSNLDAGLRSQMRIEIGALQQRLRTTTIYVTHDQVEAMTLGHRIVVLSGGRIQQVGRPIDLYRHPANRFVAGFIGTPPMNFVEGMLEADAFTGDGLRVPFRERALREAGRGAAALGIRPEDMRIVPTGSAMGDDESRLDARVLLVERLGGTSHVHANAGPYRILVATTDERVPEVGDAIAVGIPHGRCHLFDASGAVLGAAI